MRAAGAWPSGTTAPNAWRTRPIQSTSASGRGRDDRHEQPQRSAELLDGPQRAVDERRPARSRGRRRRSAARGRRASAGRRARRPPRRPVETHTKDASRRRGSRTSGGAATCHMVRRARRRVRPGSHGATSRRPTRYPTRRRWQSSLPNGPRPGLRAPPEAEAANRRSLPPSVERLERRARLRRRQRVKRIGIGVIAGRRARAGAPTPSPCAARQRPTSPSPASTSAAWTAAQPRRRWRASSRRGWPRRCRSRSATSRSRSPRPRWASGSTWIACSTARWRRTAGRRARCRSFGGGTEVPIALVPPDEPRLTPGVRRLEQKAKNAKLAVSDDGKVSVDALAGGRRRAAARAHRRGHQGRAIRTGGREDRPAHRPAEDPDGRGREGRRGGPPAALRADHRCAPAARTSARCSRRSSRRPSSSASATPAPARCASTPTSSRSAIGKDVKKLERDPVDARWVVNGRKVRIVPAKNGLALHPIDTARLVRNAGLGERRPRRRRSPCAPTSPR